MKKHNLKDQLDQYLNQQYYPMHMPGHKRRVAVVPECVLRYDLTEVSGTDDLHHASGILKDAMARLDERERRILSLRFYEGKTQMEVSAEVGISQAQVSRLEKGAINTIKKNI